MNPYLFLPGNSLTVNFHASVFHNRDTAETTIEFYDANLRVRVPGCDSSTADALRNLADQIDALCGAKEKAS